MGIVRIFKHIYEELKIHIPFTLSGAVIGVILMFLFSGVSISAKVMSFKIFHPAHVILSAMVTAAMFKLHSKYRNILFIIILSWIGSVGIATLSDVIIPHFLGSNLLGLNVPIHEAIHEHIHSLSGSLSGNVEHGHEHCEAEHSHIHFGFIDDWYIVNPAAILGILIGWFWPYTKIPHASHVLVSTWASCSYVLMTATVPITVVASFALVIVMFVAVWFPCCFSDIVFPMLFAGVDTQCPHCHSVSGHKH